MTVKLISRSKDFHEVEYNGKRYVGFWGGGPFSNFHVAPHRSCLGEVVATSEHAYMLMKAMHFKDDLAAEKIRNAERPHEAKKAGQEVEGFDQEEWEFYREAYMYMALLDKFSIRPELKEMLLATGDATLVEVSPQDKTWGIGLGLDTAWWVEEDWEGLNLLGVVLMILREVLASHED